jgi:protein subunit release factor B
MKFPDGAGVRPEKKEELLARIQRLGIELSSVQEQAVKGSGPGGQKVNKTASGVRLTYERDGVVFQVKWTRERQHSLNRFLALRELCDRVEIAVSPETSQRLKDYERIRKKKS